MTEIIRGLSNVKAKHQHAIMTIGNFDGVHLGHQKLISEVINLAKRKQTHSLVMTFEPHPHEFFNPAELAKGRITRFQEKVLQLRRLGVDYILVLKFNQALAELSASNFVKDILIKKLSPQIICLGEDFRFGHKREGDVTLLEKLIKNTSQVMTVDTYEMDSQKVSSTRIRQALGDGDLQLAKRLLGRSYTMCGRISHGDKKGRELGFPTANIRIHRKLTPLKGIFTVFVHGISAEPIAGVANLGERPTVSGRETLLEVHLLDFNKEIYGKDVQVEFCFKLRDEIRFANLEELKKQIASDVLAAQEYFKKQGVS